MSTDPTFIDHLCDQARLGPALSSKKMFGEYALYLDGKVIALVCDNQLFLKPTAAARQLLMSVSEHPPYPGAKLYFRIDEGIDDPDLLQRLFQITAQALPRPQPRRPSNPRPRPQRASLPPRAKPKPPPDSRRRRPLISCRANAQ